MTRLSTWASGRSRMRLIAATSSVVALMLASLLAGPAAAADTSTYNVGCSAGVGKVLRLIKVIRIANQGAVTHTTIINLSNCPYDFFRANSFPVYGANALPVINTQVVIHGHGAIIDRLNGGPRFRIFAVSPTGDLQLDHLTVADGAARNGRPGASHFGADGENGTAGRNGGGIYNLGVVVLNYVTMDGNRAGDGGVGGSSTGVDANDATLPLQNGDDAANVNGGWGGNGGDGGAIYSEGTLHITNSTFTNNAAGDGGLSGAATGGDGGDGYVGVQGGNGGHGGGANSGQAGDAGRGGAIFTAGLMTVDTSTFSSNAAGDGGDMGLALGGNGGNGADLDGSGGDGGGVNSWFSGTGGDGGAIYNSGTATISNSTISNNSAGDSGDANAQGGNGGNGGCGGPGGSGGGYVATQGPVGTGGGAFNAGSLTLNSDTVSGNTDGSAGAINATPGSGGSGGPSCT